MLLNMSIRRFQNPLLKILLMISISISSLLRTCHGACNPLDRASLSSFNLSLSSSPALDWSPWLDCCDWEGVACDSSGRVSNLTLPSRGLVGTMSPSIANLTSLVQLTLSHNWLSGPLPPDFFQSLNQLQLVDLSRNRLTGELVSLDKIPPNLRIFNFSSNNFQGPIIQSLPLRTSLNLEAFDVSNNSFSGTFPSDVCALSPSIQRLDFSNNKFTDSIPRGLFECVDLQSLRAGFNNLSSELPEDIYQLTTLKELYLPGNSLSGSIDHRILNLTSLRVLSLFGNEMTGPIPMEIGRLSRLEQLELHINRFNGTIPTSLANCTNLTLLNLRVNHLEGELSSFDFSNFIRLKTVDLGNNFFHGPLPRTLFSCKTLTAVRLATNNLSGEVVPEIGLLPFLSFLSVSNNSLTNLTSAVRIFASCRKLSALMIALNFYNEPFPDYDELIGFRNIQILGFGGCNLTGQVPVWLRELDTLKVVDLSLNKLTGLVPGWFGALPNLFYLDLSFNLLTGIFPMEFIQLRLLTSQMNSDHSSYLELPIFARPDNASNLQYNQLSNLPRAIILGNNSINGSIPAEIGQLKYIIALDLSNNDFTGSIPDTISHLTNLEKLDLSGNNLTGEIPASLQNLNFLSSFSVANNDLDGPVPTGGQFDTFPNKSFEGNPKLCGQILHRPCGNNNNQSGNANRSETEKRNNTNNRKKTVILTLVVSSSIFTLILLLYFFISKKGGKASEKDLEAMSFNSSGIFPEYPNETSLVMFFTNSKGGKLFDLAMTDILKATDNFNQSNIIGCGGFGLVFKATLPDGTHLAIKKLSGDTGLVEREFKAEVEALSTARHENLVTLEGYCLHGGSRLLVYSYMENGSLDHWLHERPDGPKRLDWPTRLKILRGASRGVAHMHGKCNPHIIHRDLKSSNILLDGDFEARVADFGLARLMLSYETHVTTELVGTLGYIPPEYSESWMATLRGDVYSFGVVMLEVLAGKRPVEMFSKTKVSRELVVWVEEMKGEGREREIYDEVLRGKGFEEEMGRVLQVACLCVSRNPFDRPTISEVDDWLRNVGSDVDTTL